MDAVPRLTGGGISEGIPGRIPDYMNPPTGCRFSGRCPHTMPVCTREKPPVFQIEGPEDESHEVACFLYDEPQKVDTYKAEAVPL